MQTTTNITRRFVGDYDDPRGFDVSGPDDPELVTVSEASEEVGVLIDFSNTGPRQTAGTFFQLIQADTADLLTGEVTATGGAFLGWFETWETAHAEKLRLAREEGIGARIEQVEGEVPFGGDMSRWFREDIPGEDMGRWNAFLRAA